MSDVPRSLQSWVSTIQSVVLTADVFKLFIKLWKKTSTTRGRLRKITNPKAVSSSLYLVYTVDYRAKSLYCCRVHPTPNNFQPGLVSFPVLTSVRGTLRRTSTSEQLAETSHALLEKSKHALLTHVPGIRHHDAAFVLTECERGDHCLPPHDSCKDFLEKLCSA